MTRASRVAEHKARGIKQEPAIGCTIREKGARPMIVSPDVNESRCKLIASHHARLEGICWLPARHRRGAPWWPSRRAEFESFPEMTGQGDTA
jgi:hypothetical protein